MDDVLVDVQAGIFNHSMEARRQLLLRFVSKLVALRRCNHGYGRCQIMSCANHVGACSAFLLLRKGGGREGSFRSGRTLWIELHVMLK